VAVNSTYYLEADGEALPVVAEFEGHHYSAHVLHDVNGDVEWIVTWTDGINEWVERYELPWHALARLAALVAAAEQDVFLVHDFVNRGEHVAFVAEADRFVSRTVHASSCAPGCDGTDPANHRV
jgi:hypothetical protein